MAWLINQGEAARIEEENQAGAIKQAAHCESVQTELEAVGSQ